MSNTNIRPSSRMPYAGALEAWIDSSKAYWMAAFISAATSDATVAVTQATTSGGAGAKAITGPDGAVISHTATGGVYVEFHTDLLDATNGFRWVKFAVTDGASGSHAGYVFAGDPRNQTGPSPTT